MRLSGFYLLLSLAAVDAATWSPPASNSIPWSLGICGVPGGIRRPSITYTSYTSSATPANVQTGINNCPSNQVVGMAAGTYAWSSGVTFGTGDDGVALILTNATINYSGSSAAFTLGGDTSLSAGSLLTTNHPKGSSNITVVSAAGLTVGWMCLVDQDDDTNLVWMKSALGRHLTQVSQITAVNGNTVTIWPPLIWHFSSNLTARLKDWSGTQIEYSGIEGIGNCRVDYTSATTGTGIFVDQAFGCWVKNIRSILNDNYHMDTLNSTRCTWEGNYYDDTPIHDPNHAGLRFYDNVTFCVVIDNIFFRAPPPIEMNLSTSGHIVAYNFSHDSYQDGFGQYNMLWASHGAHPMMNLYEGNYGNGVVADGYFGSASHGHVFRNRLHGWTPTFPLANSFCVGPKRWSLFWYVVGNVLGRTGTDFYSVTNQSWSVGDTKTTVFELGFPNVGNQQYTGARPPNAPQNPGDDQALDWFVLTNILRHANYDFVQMAVTNAPGEETSLPASLVADWASKPVFIGNLPWPLIGPDVNTADNATNLTLTAGEITNPARQRYFGDTNYLAAGGTRASVTGKSGFTGKAMIHVP